MPQGVSDIIDSTITRDSTAITRQAFNVPLFVAEHTVGAGRVLEYEGSAILADMVQAGHVATNPEYLMVAAAMQQSPRLNKVKIGKQNAAEAPATCMAAIEAEDQTGWVGFCYDTRADADVLALAAWAETTNHIYIGQSSTAAILAGTEDCVADTLNESGYFNTALYYHATNGNRLDCGVLARGLARDLDAPRGNGSWSGDRIVGITGDTLTGAQRNAAHGFKCNTFEERMPGSTVTREGWVASGEFIDTSIGLKWLHARLIEDLYSVLHADPDGVPYDQAGLNAIGMAIENRLNIAAANRILRPGTIQVKIPNIADIAASDISARVARTFEWTAGIQHFIHKATARGRVTV